MRGLKIKSYFSIISSKLVLFLSKHILKGGSTFPGTVALKLDSNILSFISKDYKVILITGTNGKTTTTSMITNILKENNYNVITNSTGANLYRGIVSCFIDNYKFFRPLPKNSYAVIEVDEANVKFVTEHLTPEIITITNLFRDQLDRYGEVYTTLNKILEGIKKVPSSKLVLNGDDSLFNKMNVQNPCIYYGFKVPVYNNSEIDTNADAKFCKFCKAPYKYNFVTYNHLGDFYCPECDFKRCNLTYAIDNIENISEECSDVSINGFPVTISQAGIYNIYNALCAFSIAKELDINDKIIKNSLSSQESSFGRQETIKINGTNVKIILVKNPAGYNQAIDMLCLNKKDFSALFMLNDNYADGTDISWIWDVNFEKLNTLKLKDILVSGTRMYDMAVRLKTAGLKEESFIINEDYDFITNKISSSSSDTFYILATYTAMINYRKHLYSKGFIKKLW